MTHHRAEHVLAGISQTGWLFGCAVERARWVKRFGERIGLKPSTQIFWVMKDIPLAYRGEVRYYRSVTERNTHEQTF
jgi:hypothetical protein